MQQHMHVEQGASNLGREQHGSEPSFCSCDIVFNAKHFQHSVNEDLDKTRKFHGKCLRTMQLLLKRC